MTVSSLEFFDFGAGRDDPEREASRAEADGWDGMAFADSQNILPDVYPVLALAARATERLKLITGVSNSFTRHPAVTASAAMTIQKMSLGRFGLGIGRGDSSTAYVGHNPTSVRTLERYVSIVRRLVRGESVPFADFDECWGSVQQPDRTKPVHNLTASHIEWSLPPEITPPPVQITATGPAVLALAAQSADGVLLALGAQDDRIAWAIDIIRQARTAEGLDPMSVPITAWVPAAVSADLRTARELVRPTTATQARFASMHGKAAGQMTESERTVLERVGAEYNFYQHAQPGNVRDEALPDDFVDRYAIVGTAAACAERFSRLADLGVSRFIVTRPNPLVPIDRASSDARRSYHEITTEVIPAVRERFAESTKALNQ